MTRRDERPSMVANLRYATAAASGYSLSNVLRRGAACDLRSSPSRGPGAWRRAVPDVPAFRRRVLMVPGRRGRLRRRRQRPHLGQAQDLARRAASRCRSRSSPTSACAPGTTSSPTPAAAACGRASRSSRRARRAAASRPARSRDELRRRRVPALDVGPGGLAHAVVGDQALLVDRRRWGAGCRPPSPGRTQNSFSAQ